MTHEMPDKPIQTILLVDDHELVLRALHTYLEKRGYNVLEAQDGEEALLLAECFPAMIHVLVTDLVMARMNGRELARHLMSLRPEMQVIMMSGFPDEIMAQQELTPQIPILPKPFAPKRLLMAIEEVLRNPQSERTVASFAEPAQLHNGKEIAQGARQREHRCE
jgi:two-component system, cell cycle sensor histidine kinase and response regulator CckA